MVKWPITETSLIITVIIIIIIIRTHKPTRRHRQQQPNGDITCRIPQCQNVPQSSITFTDNICCCFHKKER